ncbi:MAG TPA: hypothetical protein VFV05_01835 [Methylomirabilota bacterium]|nr:hypothetical protein [Methylomirabilota bacterium]
MLRVFADPLTPARGWLDRLVLIVPADRATRWLLVLDVACLLLLGHERRHPGLAVPLVLAAGFLALNVLGMAVTDFVLGLALFHVAVTVTAALALRRRRWFGLMALAVVLAAGILT